MSATVSLVTKEIQQKIFHVQLLHARCYPPQPMAVSEPRVGILTKMFVNSSATTVTFFSRVQVLAHVKATKPGAEVLCSVKSLPVQYYQGFLTAPNNALAKDTSTMTGVAFHVTWDTSEREALQEHVRPTDSGPVPPQVAKLDSALRCVS